jgi:hypothetical protein
MNLYQIYFWIASIKHVRTLYCTLYGGSHVTKLARALVFRRAGENFILIPRRILRPAEYVDGLVAFYGSGVILLQRGKT